VVATVLGLSALLCNNVPEGAYSSLANSDNSEEMSSLLMEEDKTNSDAAAVEDNGLLEDQDQYIRRVPVRLFGIFVFPLRLLSPQVKMQTNA
jgi:hypothetical protein